MFRSPRQLIEQLNFEKKHIYTQGGRFQTIKFFWGVLDMSSESKRGTCANKVSACSYDRSSSNLRDPTEKPFTIGRKVVSENLFWIKL